MCVDIQIQAGVQVPCQLQLASGDAALILIAELPLPRPTPWCCPHIASSSASQLEAIELVTERSSPLDVAVTESPDTTSYEAQCALGSVSSSDRQLDLVPALVLSSQPLLRHPGGAGRPCHTRGPRHVGSADSFGSIYHLGRASLISPLCFSASLGHKSGVGDLFWTIPGHVRHDGHLHRVCPPGPAPLYIQIFWDLHATDGSSFPASILLSPNPKASVVRKRCSVAKAGPSTPLESEVTTRLAANLCAEVSIASPAEIVSNMGATREAIVGVDMAPK